jgi:hypothetical protein
MDGNDPEDTEEPPPGPHMVRTDAELGHAVLAVGVGVAWTFGLRPVASCVPCILLLGAAIAPTSLQLILYGIAATLSSYAWHEELLLGVASAALVVFTVFICRRPLGMCFHTLACCTWLFLAAAKADGDTSTGSDCTVFAVVPPIALFYLSSNVQGVSGLEKAVLIALGVAVSASV